MYNVIVIRDHLMYELEDEKFVIDKSGVKTIELVGIPFLIQENSDREEKIVFGEPNLDYVQRELEWYESQSLRVADIPGKTPAIWEQVASSKGEINSNYGFLVYSYENYQQYANVLEELKRNPLSRRAIMIYTRPRIHYDYNRDGMSDFICTNTVQYLIRDGALCAIVNMRSNDAVFGFKNDYHWQHHVLKKLADDLGVAVGDIHWQAGSFHVYERHFYLVDHYAKSGETSIRKSDYDNLYPESPWASK